MSAPPLSRTSSRTVLGGLGVLLLLVVALSACEGGTMYDGPCGSPYVVDTYWGGTGDPYFGGYAGDPTYGGDPGWYDPGYYDPGYDSSGDPNSDNSSAAGGSDSTDPGYVPPADGSDPSSGSDGSGDGSGGDGTDARRGLHITNSPVASASSPGANGCYSCTVACTFAAPGNGTPAGNVAQGGSARSYDAACHAAMVALEQSSGTAALARCRSVDGSASSGRVPASPSVGAASSASTASTHGSSVLQAALRRIHPLP